MIKPVFHKKKIDSEKYVNIDTGEMLSSELNITTVNIKNDKLLLLSSQEFIVVDSVAKRYVDVHFNSTEQGKIMMMTNLVHGNFNLLYDSDKKEYYNMETLADYLGYKRTSFITFMKKLRDKSIINYFYFKNVKYIGLNPTFARKQKSFHKHCIISFKNLSDDI